MNQLRLSLIETEKLSQTEQMKEKVEHVIHLPNGSQIHSAFVGTEVEKIRSLSVPTPIGATTKSVEQVIREFRQSGEVSFIIYLRSLD